MPPFTSSAVRLSLAVVLLAGCTPPERRHFERALAAERQERENSTSDSSADPRATAEREYRAAIASNAANAANAANADLAPAYLGLSRLLVRSGKLVEVLAVARAGVSRLPTNPELRAWYGDALRRRHRFAEAERELRTALGLPGAGAYPRYVLGLLLLETGKPREARLQLQRATALEPRAAEGWYQLANASDRLGDAAARDRALARFDRLYEPRKSPPAARLERSAEPSSDARPATLRTASTSRPDRARRPNLILISIDTLRADRLGCYGGPHPTSPAIDALARDGVRFSRAYAASAWTLPSHMTMMTGLSPSAHGVNPDRALLAGRQEPSATFAIGGSPRLLTLAERLRRLGYRTAAITEGGWVAARFGFDQGFDRYVAQEDDDLDSGTQKLALAWLAKEATGENDRAFDASDRPFFLFLHTYQVHQPYRQPPPYDALFVPPGSRGYARAGVTLGMADLARFRDGSFPTLASDVEAFRARYDGEIRHTDDFIARLIARLRSTGLDRDTIVLLTSDHGEELFDHGGFDHGDTLYDEVLHVPLILWGPGRLPAGREVEAPVGSIDVTPTLVALAGGDPFAPNAPPIQGKSLLPYFAAKPAAFVDRDRFAEGFATVFHHDLDTDASVPLASVRRGANVLILHRAKPESVELYDLTRDPGETENLTGTKPALVAELRAALEAWTRENARLHALYGQATQTVDAETEKRLRALGYL